MEGRLRSTHWETKDGQKRSGIEVEAYRLQFLTKVVTDESAEGAEPGEAGESVGSAEPAGAVAEAALSKTGRGEDEIPF